MLYVGAALVVESTYDGEYVADAEPRVQRESICPHNSRERLLPGSLLFGT